MKRVLPGLLVALAACGGETVTPDAGSSANNNTPPPSDAGPRPDAAAIADSGPADTGVADTGAADTGVTDAGMVVDAGLPIDAGQPIDAGTPDSGVVAAPDPEAAGPYTPGALQVRYFNATTQNELPIECRYPTSGPDAGPYPVALIGHGFRIGIDQYFGYAERLASFGYVACVPDFPDPALRPDHVQNAQDMLGALDWLTQVNAETGHPLFGLVDVDRVGITGHSLGGKLAFLAAERDSRIDAVFGIDPVDGSMLCNATRCPDATDLLPLSVPIGVIGETLDATGRQACAPMPENFQTFYAASSAPKLEVDALGASHTSFVDDVSTCGIACAFCQSPTASQQDVLQMTRAFLTAFFERYLRGDTRYDAYLTGSIAQQRYVTTGRAMIRSQ